MYCSLLTYDCGVLRLLPQERPADLLPVGAPYSGPSHPGAALHLQERYAETLPR